MLSKIVVVVLTVTILATEIDAGRGWKERRARCYPKCERGCRKVRAEKWCYKCECEPVCPEPECKEGCTLEKFPGEQCPSCVCKDEEIPVLDVGERKLECFPKCEKGCRKNYNRKGCYKCDCEPLCSAPKCEEGCTLEKLPGDPCPSCVCKNEEIPVLDVGDRRLECFPKCETSCRKIHTGKWCYKCECEPLCPELKCKDGCTLEKLPGEQCPSCVCKDEEIPVLGVEERRNTCFPKCGEGCRKVPDGKVCYKCNCEPLCSEPDCKDGCTLEKLPGDSCPSCVCKNEEIPVLDVGESRPECFPKCEESCSKVYTGKWCYKCECEPLCPEPKCKKGCTLEKLPGDLCPSCVCKDEQIPVLDVEDRRLECFPKCARGCRKVRAEDGCYKCECEPLCSEPKCKEGCTLEKLPGEPCPSCLCKEEELPDLEEIPPQKIICDPPNCEPGCKLQQNGPCPTCECEEEEV